MNFRTILIGLAALAMAIVGAYFSIQGLAALFAGASLEIAIMAGVLEFSKIVTASFLYFYWDRVGKIMKTYLLTAVFVLVIITSIGIYGFLTAAFQSTSDQLDSVNRQVQVVEMRKERYDNRITEYRNDRNVMNEAVQQLTEGLATGNVIQYVDPESGQLVTTTSGAQRNILRDNLERAQNERDRLAQQVEAYTDSVNVLDDQIMSLRSGTDITAELGPLTFISEILDVPMGSVVNILAIMIMVTFDPLAITLVVAFNMSLWYRRQEKEDQQRLYEVYGENTPETPDFTRKSPGISTKTDSDDTDSRDVEFSDVETKFDDTALEDLKERDQETVDVEFEEVDQSFEANPADKEALPDIESNPPSTKLDERINELHNDKYNDLDFNKPKPTKVKYEVNGKYVGIDYTGNGLVDKWLYIDYYKRLKNKKPYYATPDFNWERTDIWTKDQAAINYWISNIKGNSSKYPIDFSSKIY